MRLLRIALITGMSILVSACQGANTISTQFPFPTELPSAEVLDSDYQSLIHNLSPLPGYHFRIMIPNGWRTLDTTLEKEPAKDGLADVAVFRQPGEWEKDHTAPIKGEVSVSVVNVTDDKRSPADWLNDILKKNAKGFIVINKEESPSSSGPVSDVLISYLTGTQTLVSRLMAFRAGDRMFIITGSDTADEYPENAEAFNVAISTFRLESAGKTKE